ncbi:MAG: dioxygenase, partial [Sphingopyxis sp.]|nr:dioxygenase [Sphingopyxis sp.]
LAQERGAFLVNDGLMFIPDSRVTGWREADNGPATLRDEGVLVIGSGSITHNLRAFFTTRPPIGAPAPAWVSDFTAWVAGRMEANAVDDVLHAVDRAPHGKDNHPTPDHILPLFVAMGAGAEDGRLHARRLHASTTYAVLAMDVYAFGEESVAV